MTGRVLALILGGGSIGTSVPRAGAVAERKSDAHAELPIRGTGLWLDWTKTKEQQHGATNR